MSGKRVSQAVAGKPEGSNPEKPRGGSVVPKDGERFLHKVSEGRLGETKNVTIKVSLWTCVEEPLWEKTWNQDCLRSMLGAALCPMLRTSHSPSDSHGAGTHVVSVQLMPVRTKLIYALFLGLLL